MTWYWYAARSNELFLDLDSPEQQRRALRVLRLALKDHRRFWSGKSAKLEVDRFRQHLVINVLILMRSVTLGHCHLIVVNNEEFQPMTRVAWSLWLGGDPLRAAYALERLGRGYCPELIALQYPIQEDFRQPDAMCPCKDKHKEERVTKYCPALNQLLGDHAAADYFPRVRDERRKLGPLILPYGRLSLTKLERWENPRWTKNKLTSI